MCGITGFFEPVGFRLAEAEAILLTMRDRLLHRGPDDAGVWLDAKAGIALGHRRLSILDLSPAGHQPMISTSGRYVLIFNGEIYNHLELRRLVEASSQLSWRGYSDTESLLAAIEYWGLEKTLKKTVGMFALALWDRQECHLSLARDRIGEKPLYYGWQRGSFLFGSELKALRAHPSFENRIDQNVLPLYLACGYIPTPWSVWNGIYKLPAGTTLTVNVSHTGQLPVPLPYWSFSNVALYGEANPFNGSDNEAIDTLESTLRDAVINQMVSDVPLGVFLSGGVDSSTVAALMQSNFNRPVKTFSIGFHETAYNEAEYAKAVAASLGTEHTELYVTEQHALDIIPSLHQMYDEPFGDSSSIPTYLVSRMTKAHVTVALSGDGGDELFAGYDRYNKVLKAQSLSTKLPSSAIKVLTSQLSLQILQTVMAMPSCLEVVTYRLRVLARQIELFSRIAGSRSLILGYRDFTNLWYPKLPTLNHSVYNNALADMALEKIASSLHQMMALDSVTYLPDDILVKVDRAAMAAGLETRAPFLDHRVVELAWRLPSNLCHRGRTNKWILRQVLYRYVPSSLIERPKMGFSVPVDNWLGSSLREWAEDLLSEHSLADAGFFDTKSIRQRWQQHLQGHLNWRDSLWAVLMWQAWHRSL
jgi:asparagine synthase (glutamine-hydrolysing)